MILIADITVLTNIVSEMILSHQSQWQIVKFCECHAASRLKLQLYVWDFILKDVWIVVKTD